MGAESNIITINTSEMKIDNNVLADFLFTRAEEILSKQENVELAITHLLRAIELKPNFASAHNDLCLAYWQKEEYELAIHHIKKAVSLERDNRIFLLNYCDVLVQIGMKKVAEEYLENYLAKNPEDQEIAEYLNIVHFCAGDNTEGIKKEVVEPKLEITSHDDSATKREKERLALYFYSTDKSSTKNEGKEFLSDILKRPMNNEESKVIQEVMKIGGLFTENDSLSLYRLSKQASRNGKILELGSYRGRSSNAIGHALKDTDRILYCIDTWTTFDLDEIAKIDPTAAPIAKSYYTVFEDFLKNTSWFASQQRVMRGSVKEYSDLLPSKFFDVIFIDASHDYPNGCFDISVALRCLKPGGIICGHDYWMDFPGLIEAVKEKLFSRNDLEEYGVVYDTYGFWFAKFKEDAPL